MNPDVFEVGSPVRKIGGSYQATGTIRASFQTRNGQQRYVFDFDEPPGLLHIFNHEQLEGAMDSNKDVAERFAEALDKAATVTAGAMSTLPKSDPPVYSSRREPVLVCPCCKRAVLELIATKDGKPFDVFRCREHGDVVAIWSEVVNEY